MTFAITIGCYRLADFIELNILQCREVFGKDVPILLSDDDSPESFQIQALAEKHGCYYTKSDSHMSHFSGDLQAILNMLNFTKQTGVDIGIKLSQRLIPMRPEFRQVAEAAFADPQTMVVVPGKPPRNQISTKAGMFYAQFEILSDVVAVWHDAIEPIELAEIYRQRVREGKQKFDCLVETTIHWLIHNRFHGKHHVAIQAWAEHKLGDPKAFLRKTQSVRSEYVQAGIKHGIDGRFDLREWINLEGNGYVGRTSVV